MLQDVYNDEPDVGVVETAANAYRREKRDHDWTKAQLRGEKAARARADGRAKVCTTEQAQKKRFYDRRMLHPVISLPPSPWAIAFILASLITVDRKTGFARRPVNGLRFERDKGVDIWAAPTEVNAALVGDCAKFVRQEGAFRGVAVGCARLPRGFHVWLREANGRIIDVCVDRGMPTPPPNVYAMGVYADIANEPLRVPVQFDNQLPTQFDGPEMETEANPSWDDAPPWPTFGGTDDIDTAGVDELVLAEASDETNDEAEVAGVASSIAAVVGLAGSIGSVLATAYGGPAAGAMVNAAANGTAGLIASFEEKAPPKRSTKAPTKHAAAPVHKQAVNAALTSKDPMEALLAKALAVASSDDPKVIEALRNRMKQPRAADPDPKTRMSLEAALAAMHLGGYEVPVKQTPQQKRGLLTFSREELEAAKERKRVNDDPYTFVEGFSPLALDASNYDAGCPGTCPAN